MDDGPTPAQLEIQRRNHDWEARCVKERPGIARTQFTVGANLAITDPCYDRGTWCAIWNQQSMPGVWAARVETKDEDDWGERNAVLEARHVGYQHAASDWEYIGRIGVDSGQAGIFAMKSYPSGDDTGEPHDSTSFYGRCCVLTLTEPNWGMMDEGVVSTSGFGDGSYEVYGLYDLDNSKLLVGVRIVFIHDEDDA